MSRKYRLLLPILTIALFYLSGCAATGDLKTARDAMNAGQLRTAYMHYENVLAENPANSEAKEQLADLGEQISKSAISDAQAMMNAQSVLTVPLLENAMAHLREALSYDPAGKYLPSAIREYEDKTNRLNAEIGTRVKQTQTALEAGKFDLARENMAYIKEINPASEWIKVLEPQYYDSYAGALEEEIERYLAEGDLMRAGASFETLKQLPISAERMNSVSLRFRDRQIKLLNEKVSAYLENNQYYSAYLEISASGREDVMADALKTIRQKGAVFYRDQAQKRFAADDYGRAYLEAVKGFELDEKLSGMFEIHRDTRDQIMKDMQQYIAVPAFGAPAEKPDLGPQFSDALISYLFRILPYGINIVEREKIDMLMEEQERGLEEVGDVLNVDLIVTGNVSLLNIESQKSETQATVRAQVGQKTEPNPQYAAVLQAMGKNVVESRLPPAMITVPEYETFKYTKGSVTVKGFANVSVRMFDTEKGGIIYAQEFNANYQQVDDFQDAVEIANVEGDPLQLPTETEVAEKLRNKIIQQVADVIQVQFDKREKNFLESAHYFIARKEVPKAMEPLAQGFLYSVKQKVPLSDPDFSAIRDLIVQHSEKNFL